MKRLVFLFIGFCLSILSPGCGSGGREFTGNGLSSDPSTLPQNWPSYIQPKEWQTAGRLPKGLYDHAATIWENPHNKKRYLYVSGGFGPGPSVNTLEIYIYEILPDFTLEFYGVSYLPDKMLSLTTSGGTVQAQVVGLDGHVMFTHNGYLYVVGGKFQYQRTDCFPPPAGTPCMTPTPTAWNRAVFFAPLDKDSGTVGTWAPEVPFPSSSLLSVGTYTPGVAVYSDRLYIAGGWDGDRLTNTNTIISAILFPGGGLSDWRVEPNKLPEGLSKHAVVAAKVADKGFLYVIGGNTGGAVSQDGYTQGFENSVYYAPIDPDGNTDGILGAWTLTAYLPDTWIDHKAVAVQDYLLVIGGRNVNEYYSDLSGQGTYYNYILHQSIVFAQIQSNGSLTTWQTYKGLPAEIQNGIVRHAVATTPGLAPEAVYLVGGSTGQQPELTSCEGGICSAPYKRVNGIHVLNFMP